MRWGQQTVSEGLRAGLVSNDKESQSLAPASALRVTLKAVGFIALGVSFGLVYFGLQLQRAQHNELSTMTLVGWKYSEHNFFDSFDHLQEEIDTLNGNLNETATQKAISNLEDKYTSLNVGVTRQTEREASLEAKVAALDTLNEHMIGTLRGMTMMMGRCAPGRPLVGWTINATGDCAPAACDIKGSNHEAGSGCACAEGHEGEITWWHAAWVGNCAKVTSTTTTTTTAGGFKSYSHFGDKPYGPVTLFVKDEGSPKTGTVAEIDSFCQSKGLSMPLIMDPNTDGTCYGYSYSHRNFQYYQAMKDFWDTKVTSKYGGATYEDVLILHGNVADCFAYNHAIGALHVFGDPSENRGCSYCRGGGMASKRFHIYVCTGTYAG